MTANCLIVFRVGYIVFQIHDDICFYIYLLVFISLASLKYCKTPAKRELLSDVYFICQNKESLFRCIPSHLVSLFIAKSNLVGVVSMLTNYSLSYDRCLKANKIVLVHPVENMFWMPISAHGTSNIVATSFLRLVETNYGRSAWLQRDIIVVGVLFALTHIVVIISTCVLGMLSFVISAAIFSHSGI